MTSRTMRRLRVVFAFATIAVSAAANAVAVHAASAADRHLMLVGTSKIGDQTHFDTTFAVESPSGPFNGSSVLTITVQNPATLRIESVRASGDHADGTATVANDGTLVPSPNVAQAVQSYNAVAYMLVGARYPLAAGESWHTNITLKLGYSEAITVPVNVKVASVHGAETVLDAQAHGTVNLKKQSGPGTIPMGVDLRVTATFQNGMLQHTEGTEKSLQQNAGSVTENGLQWTLKRAK